MYAVIDVETTGLRTSWHDRVIEIGVVHVDAHGTFTGQWCSLVNPNRDLGPQIIHGISAAEARRAPTFDQLAGTIAGLLRGRVTVAHNLAFDAQFLHAEFGRLGIEIPIGTDSGLCTMRLATHFLPTAARNLHDCRRQAGLPAHRAHSALHDARAAADLLTYYLAAAGTPPPWSHTTAHAMTAAWPHIATTTTEPVLRRAAGHREEHFLARLVDRLPPLREPVGDAYLDVLDHALIDRHISACEADALVAAADTLGLARVDVHSLHRTYLTQLAAAALDDGILTTAERRDLNTVAELLGLQTSDVDHALTAATNPPAANSDEVSDAAGDEAHNTTGDHPAGRPQWRLEPGDTIVLTGAMNPPREQWHAATIAAGLRVGDNVTKTTRLLVAADPDSMSGKAKKARQYRIPIIHPTAYQNILRNRRVGSIGM